MALVMFQVIVGEQHLGDMQVVLGKKLVIGGHQPGLAHGGTGLFFGELGGACLVAQRAHARPHRAAGDQDDLLARRRRAAICATSCSSCAGSISFRLSVRTPVPSLTTMRELDWSESR